MYFHPERPDVLVIGAGVVGITTAYFLTERGYQVVVIDKGEVGSGSSYGNAGLIVPSHSVPLAAPGVLSQGIRWLLRSDSPFYIHPRMDRALASWLWKFRSHCNEEHVQRAMPLLRDMHRKSLELFETFAHEEKLRFGFERRGRLMLFRTQDGLKEGLKEAILQQRAGIEYQALTADELKTFLPEIPVEAVGAVFYPQDAHLIPDQFVREVARKVAERGGEVRPHTEAIGLKKEGNRITTVHTTRGDFTPDVVILAAGSWTPEIVRELKWHLPIQPAKGYSVTFKRPAIAPPLPLMLVEIKVAVTPMGAHIRLAGTLEMTGMDLSINRRRVEAILEGATGYLPTLNWRELELVEIWRGLRPCTPDGLPLLGRSPNAENLIIAAGHATVGFSLGPISGHLVAQIVAEEKPDVNLHRLRVDRFET